MTEKKGLDYTANWSVFTGNSALSVLAFEQLTQPVNWKRPRIIRISRKGDIFHPEVTDKALDRLFAVMAYCDWHTFELNSAYIERFSAYCCDAKTPGRIARQLERLFDGDAKAQGIAQGLMGSVPMNERLAGLNDPFPPANIRLSDENLVELQAVGSTILADIITGKWKQVAPPAPVLA